MIFEFSWKKRFLSGYDNCKIYFIFICNLNFFQFLIKINSCFGSCKYQEFNSVIISFKSWGGKKYFFRDIREHLCSEHSRPEDQVFSCKCGRKFSKKGEKRRAVTRETGIKQQFAHVFNLSFFSNNSSTIIIISTPFVPSYALHCFKIYGTFWKIVIFKFLNLLIN